MQPLFNLASRSLRRRALLAQLGLNFFVRPADVDETPRRGQLPTEFAVANALAKARAVVADASGLPVLGADTDVAVDGDILGKPHDRDDALRMLARLSGRSHEVFSAVAMVQGAREVTRLSVTRVTFGTVSPRQAEAYWDSGEPEGKAGAYAIQGYAARWVKSIEGSYTGVVGLPLYETVDLLEAFDIEVIPSAMSRLPSSAR